MLCECGEREATVHEVIIKNGKKVEKHLCEQCAKAQGFDPKAGVPISQLISSFVLASPGAKAAKALVCETCQTTYDSFKQSGLLGCPECYNTFESELSPLLERSHEGGTHHVGKQPIRATAARARGVDPIMEARKRAEQIKTLRHQLDMALTAEQYEKAARLRDQIREVTESEEAFDPDSDPPAGTNGAGDSHEDQPS